MKDIVNQFLDFLQQGIAAIFRFVELIWSWSIDQINRAAEAPWASWPLWKQVLLVLVIAAVAYWLLIAARQLWVAGVRVLAAFASFLGALVVTLPPVLIAGVIALGGLWLINNLNLSSLDNITLQSPEQPAQTSGTTGQGHSESSSER